MVVYLSVVTVLVAAFIELSPWTTQAGTTPGIAIVAKRHSLITNAYLPLSNPSLDLRVILKDEVTPTLRGILRLNLVTADDTDGEAAIGLALPKHSTLQVGGSGPGVLHSYVEGPNLANQYESFTCDSTLLSELVGNAREVTRAFSDSGYEWTFECLETTSVVWMMLPEKTLEHPGSIASDAQRLATSTAGHIGFEIPEYAGFTRAEFDRWNLAFMIESGRDITDDDAMSVSELFDVDLDSVVSIRSDGGATIEDPLPSDYNYEERVWLSQPAYVWSSPLDGGVRSFSASVVSDSYSSLRAIVGFASPLVLGVGVGWVLGWSLGQRRANAR